MTFVRFLSTVNSTVVDSVAQLLSGMKKGPEFTAVNGDRRDATFGSKTLVQGWSPQASSELGPLLFTLGHAAYNLTYYAHRCDSLSVPNQFFLVLIKLRVHLPNFQLSRMFAVSNIFITWINFMACQWREINTMPSREMVK